MRKFFALLGTAALLAGCGASTNDVSDVNDVDSSDMPVVSNTSNMPAVTDNSDAAPIIPVAIPDTTASDAMAE